MRNGVGDELRLACGVQGLGERPLDETLSAIASAGFSAVEFSWERAASGLGGEDRVAGALLSLLARHGLSLAAMRIGVLSVAASEDAGILRHLRERMSLSRSMGLDAITIAAGRRGMQSMAVLADALRVAAGYAAELGLRLGLRNRHDSRIEQVEDVRYLLGELPPSVCELAVDVGEFHASAVNACHLFREFPSQIGLVLLGDRLGRRPVPIGRGEVNLGAVIRAARGVGFSGWFVAVPEAPAGERPDRALQALRSHLVTLAAETS